MSYRRDTVTSTTTRTPEPGPVRWWLLIVGALVVLSLLTWGFAATVHHATVADARGALTAAGLSAVTIDGGTYRDLALTGPVGDEAAARAALEGLDLPYNVSYQVLSDAASPSPEPSAAPVVPEKSAQALPSPSPSASETPVVIPDLPELSGIQFDNSAATLTGASTAVLDQAADALIAAIASHPTLRVAINGYTDSQGDPAANLTLSQQRADAVSVYLVSRGVPADVLSPTGYGDANPISSNDTADGRAANRRVEFVSTEG